MLIRAGNSWGLLWAAVTLGGVLGGLVLTVAAPLVADETTRGVYPSVAFAALVVWLSLVVVIYSLRSFDVQVAPWTAWVAGGVTVALSLGPIGLWYLGRDGLGYQISQALGVGGTPYGFGDMDVVLSWLDCPRQGIDPYAAEASSCAVGPSNYGPAIFWLSPTGLDRAFAPLLGVIGVVLSALAIVWLMRQTSGFGRITLLLVSASAAWILLQERANLDAAIVWSAVFLVWLVRSRAGLWPWIVAAIPIWVLGTWKYYPFAMALALLPVLRVRHGWSVLVGFAVLTVGYLVWAREYVMLSLASNSSLSGGEFWGIGRDVAAAFVAGEANVRTGWGWADVLVGLIAIAAFAWGWTLVGRCKIRASLPDRPLWSVPLTAEAMLAFGGASAAVLAVGVSGFGYHYKAALLILGVPLLARLTHRGDRAVRQAALLMLVLVVIGMFVTTNLLLTSLATIVVAGFLAGASVRRLLAWWPWVPNVGSQRRDLSATSTPTAG